MPAGAGMHVPWGGRRRQCGRHAAALCLSSVDWSCLTTNGSKRCFLPTGGDGAQQSQLLPARRRARAAIAGRRRTAVRPPLCCALPLLLKERGRGPSCGSSTAGPSPWRSSAPPRSRPSDSRRGSGWPAAILQEQGAEQAWLRAVRPCTVLATHSSPAASMQQQQQQTCSKHAHPGPLVAAHGLHIQLGPPAQRLLRRLGRRPHLHSMRSRQASVGRQADRSSVRCRGAADTRACRLSRTAQRPAAPPQHGTAASPHRHGVARPPVGEVGVDLQPGGLLKGVHHLQHRGAGACGGRKGVGKRGGGQGTAEPDPLRRGTRQDRSRAEHAAGARSAAAGPPSPLERSAPVPRLYGSQRSSGVESTFLTAATWPSPGAGREKRGQGAGRERA